MDLSDFFRTIHVPIQYVQIISFSHAPGFPDLTHGVHAQSLPTGKLIALSGSIPESITFPRLHYVIQFNPRHGHIISAVVPPSTSLTARFLVVRER